MNLTRTQTPPAPSPVDSASFERESPLRVTAPAPALTKEVETSPEIISDEPVTRTGRLSKQLTGLSDDLKEIAELRIALAKAEVTERVDYGVGRAKQGSVSGVIALLGAFFLLVTVALGLGWLLGHPFWGFLIVTVAILLIAGIAWFVLNPKPPTTQK